MKRSNNNLAFIDVIFNVLIGFTMLFIMAFLMINPSLKKADIPSKAEIIVILEWEDESIDDLDLWISGDMPRNISWQNRQSGYRHLDRDDLGASNDIAEINGQSVALKYNKEVATLRGTMPGDFYLNVHVYTKRDKEPVKFKVTVIDINPYVEAYQLTEVATQQDQIFVFPAFNVNPDGDITNVFLSEKHFAAARTGIEKDPDVRYFDIPNKSRFFATGGE
jgi:hypothetical protein